eukprot:jgi/Mesvir1/25233/Mv20301-RA.1
MTVFYGYETYKFTDNLLMISVSNIRYYTSLLPVSLSEKSVRKMEIIMQLAQNKSLPPMPSDLYDADKSTEIASKLFEQIFEHPEKFTDINLEYIHNLQKLIADSVAKFTGKKSDDQQDLSFTDKRFRDPAWQQSIYFAFIKKYYMISADWIKKTVGQYELDNDGKRFLEFITSQFIDALSPSNFAFSNPEVIRESLESGMSNIVKGMENFLLDIKKSGSLLTISTTDKSYFKIGKNLATTKGMVIFQNDLIQLICYAPKKKVHSIPIFILPPWINKYYILDLSEENSLIKWLVENNFQVFLVSWVNPTKELADKDFEDYLHQGVIEPLEHIQKLGFEKVNAAGYCIGGTLLAIALSYYKAHNSNIINSATFLTTLVDFSTPGGKQYKVAKNSIIKVEKIEGQLGSKIELNEVLLVGEYSKPSFIGTPVVKGATVTAEITNQFRDDKIIVFKKKRRQHYRRKNGHRQDLTELKILDIVKK